MRVTQGSGTTGWRGRRPGSGTGETGDTGIVWKPLSGTKASGMKKGGPMPNRVGGWPLVGQPTSHTTVHAGPHTAVPLDMQIFSNCSENVR